MAKKEYTQKTLKELRDRGALVGMTEHFNPYAGADKPPKYLITSVGDTVKFKLGQTITQSEFNEENATLHRSNLKRMEGDAIADGKFGIRQDLFGFIDMIAVIPGRGIVGVQSTGPSGFSSHKNDIIKKYKDNALTWLAAGGFIELWSWKKEPIKPGARMERWKPRIHIFTPEDFEEKPVIEKTDELKNQLKMF